MATFKIKVYEKEGVFDAVGSGVLKDIADLGINGVRNVRFAFLYYLTGTLTESDAKLIARELLIDKITQDFSLYPLPLTLNPTSSGCIEVAYNSGVMDPSEESIMKALVDMGISSVDSVRTAREYLLEGDISGKTAKTIAEELLYNKIIQHVVKPQIKDLGQSSDRHCEPAEGGRSNLVFKNEIASSPSGKQELLAMTDSRLQSDYRFNLITVDLLGASDKKLLEISKQGQLFLNLAEMRQIKSYFKKIKRNPTDVELETVAQTWSEHCGHKTFRGKIEYKEGVRGKGKAVRSKIINNLLKSTIMKVTKELNKPWCVSVFKDNSGIIKFDDKYNVCFKVETHNHPSALEPFGGANTGIGGVIRDPLGTGLGAKPILNTNVFCFGKPDYPQDKLPEGVLHPKRVAKGVVSGVRDYGNKMGIPTVNGAVLFDDGYLANPLVYCGTVGIMPKDKCFKKVSPGDLIVVAGGRTGRDGIHGATFSSGELTHESEELSGGAVQIGNPITEKKILDVLMQARDKNLYSAITDCGAGGLSSAVGEMGEETGAIVYLDKVPIKYHGLSYAEIWISEAQERMVLAVSPKNKDALLKMFAAENAEATVIGEFTSTKRLELFYQGNKVSDIEMKFLHSGQPRITKKAVWKIPKYKEPDFSCPKDLTASLKKILSHYDVASKEWIIRQYDHEVQGGLVIKPLIGIANDGPSDAAIVKPRLDSNKAVIVSNGINFKFGLIDPYWMAASCIDEALRQIISVGGSLKEAALLDNFCWGNPDKPDRLGGLVRAAEGCYFAAKGFGTPFISGKDSLYNEYSLYGKSTAIPGALLISAIAVMDDARKAISMDAKEAGNLIYAVGNTYDELGGSHYFDTLGFIGNSLPVLRVKEAKTVMEKLSLATAKGLVRSSHDCSEGGIGVSLAEMAFAGGLGMEIFLAEVPCKGQGLRVKGQGQSSQRNDFVLFSESNSRFVVEVEKKKQNDFEKAMKGVALGLIGCLSKGKDFKVYGLDGKVCVRADIYDLKESWQKPLRW